MTKEICVHSIATDHNGSMKFAIVLPQVASPWFSMGDAETLGRIGELLDNLSGRGYDKPQWEVAQKIAQIHHEYANGAYSEEYERCPSGHYAPGHCFVGPVYEGRYQKWNFHLKLVATVGRTVEIFIGIVEGCALRTLTVNFGPNGSSRSAGQVKAALGELGLRFYADGVEAQHEAA